MTSSVSALGQLSMTTTSITDKKTITVPWNYTVKLEEINRLVKEFGGPDAKIKTFSGYLNECWEEAMKHSDTQLKTAAKPAKAGK